MTASNGVCCIIWPPCFTLPSFIMIFSSHSDVGNVDRDEFLSSALLQKLSNGQNLLIKLKHGVNSRVAYSSQSVPYEDQGSCLEQCCSSGKPATYDHKDTDSNPSKSWAVFISLNHLKIWHFLESEWPVSHFLHQRVGIILVPATQSMYKCRGRKRWLPY